MNPENGDLFLTVRNVRAGFTVTLFRAAICAMHFFVRYDINERDDEEIGGTTGIKV